MQLVFAQTGVAVQQPPDVSFFGVDTAVAAALVTAIVTLLIFFAGRAIGYLGQKKQERSHKESLVRSIYTEISHNVEELENSVSHRIDSDTLRQHFERNPHAPVLIVYSRNMSFYDELRRELTVLHRDLLDSVVRFYSELEKVYRYCDSVVRFYSELEKVYRYCDSVAEKPFANISISGKVGVLDNLTESENDAFHAAERRCESFIDITAARCSAQIRVAERCVRWPRVQVLACNLLRVS